MYRQINKADFKNAVGSLNKDYLILVDAIPIVSSVLDDNPTTPFVLHALIQNRGVYITEEWCKRLVTYCSLSQQRPVSNLLILMDHELTKFILICSKAGWL